MTSRIQVFDKYGYGLGDIEANTTRSWVLNDVGRCDFDFAKTDTKCTPAYLEFGNILLITHEKLPAWVGVIYTPREWNNEAVNVTAYSAEWILSKRNTSQKVVTGTAGTIFKSILNFSNAHPLNDKPILPGSVFDGGVTIDEELKDDALTHVQNIAEASGNDFDVTHSLDINGRLQLLGNWYEVRGIQTGEYFREGGGDGHNIELSSNIMTEQDDFYNEILGYGDAESSSTRILSVQYDDDSIRKYGLLQGITTLQSSNTPATVQEATKQYLQENREPKRVFDLSALDVGNTFKKLAVGNVWNTEIHSVGFLQNGFGASDQVRIIGMEYIDAVNKVRLIVEVVNG